MRYLLTIPLMLSSLLMLAQTKNLNGAYFSLESGKINQAKSQIDEAMVHEKTKTNVKTWYYASIIYNQLIDSSTTLNVNDKLNLLTTSKDAHLRCKSLDEKNKYNKDLVYGMQNLSLFAFNLGLEEYNNTQYANSLKAFEAYSELMSVLKSAQLVVIQTLEKSKLNENTPYLLAGYSALNVPDTSKTLYFFEKVRKTGDYNDAIFVRNLANLYRIEKRYDDAISLLKSGMQVHPQNPDLILDEVQVINESKKGQHIIDSYEKSTALSLQEKLVLANLYELQHDSSSALHIYKKLQIEHPDHFLTNYFLGLHYYNSGADLTQKATSNGVSYKKYLIYEERFTEEFRQARPFLEKSKNANSCPQQRQQEISEMISQIDHSLEQANK